MLGKRLSGRDDAKDGHFKVLACSGFLSGAVPTSVGEGRGVRKGNSGSGLGGRNILLLTSFRIAVAW